MESNISVRAMSGSGNKVVVCEKRYPMDAICKVIYKWVIQDGKIKYYKSNFPDEDDNIDQPLLSYNEMVKDAGKIIYKTIDDITSKIIKEISKENLTEKYYNIDLGLDRQFEFTYMIHPENSEPFEVRGVKLIVKNNGMGIDRKEGINEYTDDISKIDKIISKMVGEFVNVLCKIFLQKRKTDGGVL